MVGPVESENERLESPMTGAESVTRSI